MHHSVPLVDLGWTRVLIAKRVLILEDEPVTAMLLAKLIAGMGHGVLGTVGSVAEAIATAQRVRPDLMIVDKRLRDGSGIAAVETIIATGFVPHIIASGESRGDFPRHPCAAVLEKPYRPAELGKAIQAVLSARPSCAGS